MESHRNGRISEGGTHDFEVANEGFQAHFVCYDGFLRQIKRILGWLGESLI